MSRHPAPAWLRPITERLSPTIRNLVIAESAVFGLFVMAVPLRPVLRRYLLVGERLWSGEVWQLLTSLFLTTDPLSFLFNMLGLWFAGVAVERRFGWKRFLLLFFATGLASNLVLAAFMPHYGAEFVSYPGCGESVLALIVALGVVYGRAPLRVFGQLALQARVLAFIFVGISLLASLMQAAWPFFVATVVAQSLAYFLSGGKAGILRAFLAGLRQRRRGSLQVLEGGRTKGRKDYLN